MILLTGGNGFLGKKIKNSLNKNNIPVLTLGKSSTNDIQCDLAFEIPNLPAINMVIHAAGKAHTVPKTDNEKRNFYEVNVKGTQNILSALGNLTQLKKFVFISSVAVYGLSEGKEIDEHAPLNAADPYGASKIEAERLITEWCKPRGIDYYILRLPLIVGDNPPGNLGSMIKAIQRGYYFSIGSAKVKKSMVLANDVAKLIPDLNNKSGIYNLTDGYHPTFDELERAISNACNKGTSFKIPLTFAHILAKIGDKIGNKSPINTDRLKKIQSELTFSDKKARLELGWNPEPVLNFYK